MADPNHIVLKDYRLAFIQPCKCANLSQKAAIARALGWPLKHLAASEYGWDYRRASQFPTDALVIGTVRHPCDRLVSAWAHTQRDFDRLKPGRWGFERDWTVQQAAEHVCSLSDEETNEHFRSLSYEFESIEPDILIRFESLRRDWERTRFAVRQHCGLDLPRLEHSNQSKHGRWKDELKMDTEKRVRERYSDDFRRWY